MLYIHLERLFALKMFLKWKIMPSAATGMDLEIVILSEVSQTEKDGYHDITCMWNLKKMVQMVLIYKIKIESQM